jgi:hypothetical protein
MSSSVGEEGQAVEAEVVPVDPAKLRSLKIKSGVVKRYMKDLMGYRMEVVQQKAKIEKFKAEGKEELFLRQQVGNLRESEMLIPDITNRLTVRTHYHQHHY